MNAAVLKQFTDRLRGWGSQQLPGHQLGDSKSIIAYRAVIAELNKDGTTGGCRSVMCTSAKPGEGKSSVSLNLAAVAAAEGQRVLLVDASAGRPVLHEVLSVSQSPGVADLLYSGSTVDLAPGSVDLASVCNQLSDTVPVSFLPSGNMPSGAEPEQDSSAGALKDYCEAHAAQFDLIIIDGPTVSRSPMMRSLCGVADGVILVLRAGGISNAEAVSAKAELELLKARIEGVVINRYDEALHALSFAISPDNNSESNSP